MTAQELVRKKIRKIFGMFFLEEAGGIPRNMSYSAMHSAKYRNNKNYPFHKGIKNEITLDEISPEEVSVPKEYIHDKLNQQIWKGDVLRPEIRKQLLKIAKQFYEFLDIEAPIKGVKFIGSMANFNWSSHSDLDVHLFFDFSDINDDTELVRKYVDTKKSLWASKHDINIKNYPVELYCQDINEKNFSSGVYDLGKDQWEIKPVFERFEIDKGAVVTKIVSMVDQIENLENNKQLDAEQIHEQGELLKKRIKRMRQCGLEEQGEFSVENISFKYLRNNGYLEKLFDLTRGALDKSLSLNQ